MAPLTSEQLLQSIWAALRRIEDNLALPPAPMELPAPSVNVDAPDLTDIVNAVNQLKPGPTADEIARAIASTLSPNRPDSPDVMTKLVESLEKLDYRLKGEGAKAFGGGTTYLAKDSQFTISGALPAGTNNIGVVGTVPGQKVGQGRFFLAGTGRLSLSAAGNLRAVVENPAGSGKTISIARFVAYSTAAGFARLYLNPTTGVPATAARPLNNAVFGGGLPGVAVLRADTNLTVALAGGTDTGIDLGVPVGRTSIDFPPLVITPGVTMGINVPFAGAAEASLDLYWWED